MIPELELESKWNHSRDTEPPRCSFPTVIIGDDVIVGYKEDKIKEALGL